LHHLVDGEAHGCTGQSRPQGLEVPAIAGLVTRLAFIL